MSDDEDLNEAVVPLGSMQDTLQVNQQDCNILIYISSVNTWAPGDSPLAQLVKRLDLCLFLCVIQRLWARLPTEPINILTYISSVNT